MRILVVDDESVSRLKLAAILSAIADCDAAVDGREAMEAFERAWLDMRPYDLMCLDYQMPGPDGMEVLSQIRKKEEQLGVGPLARLRVIMVTARSEIGVVLSFLAAGCDEYIVKPFDAATVHDKIKGIFEAPLPPLEPGRQPDGE